MEELRKLNFFIYDILSEGIAIYNDGFIEEAKRILEEIARKLKIVKDRDKWVFQAENSYHVKY